MSKQTSKKNEAVSLPERVLALCGERGHAQLLLDEPLVLGVSGGADSLALWHILVALRSESARELLHVGHLDHGFRGSESADDAEFVASLCREWGIGFTSHSLDVPGYAAQRKLSLEDAARRARYAFLGGLATERGATLTVAHTADDQAETLLMNILRGTGISGLAGMRWLTKAPVYREEPGLSISMGQTYSAAPLLFRPLLGTWRREIDEYCALHALQPRHDETNLDTTFLRNRVRHDLIPLITESYNKSAKHHLWQLAETAALEDDAMEALVTAIWPRLTVGQAAIGELRIQPEQLTGEPEAIRRRVARRALLVVAGTLDGFAMQHIKTVSELLDVSSRKGGRVDLPNGISVMQREGMVHLWKRGAVDPSSSLLPGLPWPIMQPGSMHFVQPSSKVRLSDGWSVEVSVEKPSLLVFADSNLIAQFDMAALDDTSRLVIRTRRPGDHIVPFGMEGTKSLQDLFVDAKIPRDVRDCLPLLALHGSSEILWVSGPGGRRSNQAPITGATESVIRVEFERVTQPEGEA